MPPPDYSAKLIDELQMNIKMFSIRGVIKDLQNARKNSDPVNMHINFISDLVCDNFNITIEKLKEGSERQDMTYARAFIVHYLRIEFKIEWKELKSLLGRDQSNLFRCSRLIKQLNPKLEIHKLYCGKKELFDEKIKIYQKQSKK